ncbi:hypothetical protein [Pyrobaculum neutrophilum]|uniref:Uncharacterized protein n=1 Tax=Pyrobaculum neutrophilum (strain DSM 2338 / JCM 9278 / NBRC 100436 / V24Sta) TaxID=444157 RepID=B1YDD7_PYRNV|nr:hypothetical protein [Pyrobaculum neutrophilum]ACB39800.1 conserved hypothetical protein [Pyrobaculum neutrophilum V24Sta]
MRKALSLVAASYAVLLLLFATGAASLPILRIRLAGGFTVGDVVIILAVLLYGMFIYIYGQVLIRGSCRGGRRND